MKNNFPILYLVFFILLSTISCSTNNVKEELINEFNQINNEFKLKNEEIESMFLKKDMIDYEEVENLKKELELEHSVENIEMYLKNYDNLTLYQRYSFLLLADAELTKIQELDDLILKIEEFNSKATIQNQIVLPTEDTKAFVDLLTLKVPISVSSFSSFAENKNSYKVDPTKRLLYSKDDKINKSLSAVIENNEEKLSEACYIFKNVVLGLSEFSLIYKDFNTPEEIEISTIFNYALEELLADKNRIFQYHYLADDMNTMLIPCEDIETVVEYCFGIKDLNFSKIANYDEGKNSFIFKKNIIWLGGGDFDPFDIIGISSEDEIKTVYVGFYKLDNFDSGYYTIRHYVVKDTPSSYTFLSSGEYIPK